MTDSQNFNRISLTAHYTSYVWKKSKLADSDLSTFPGWLLYQLARPLNFIAARKLQGQNLETYLVKRHRAIDAFLEREIDSGRINQVIELAAGLSPRGEKFMRRYGTSHGLIYVESDLPDQIRLKQTLLRQSGAVKDPRHHFLPINAASNAGESDSIENVALELLDTGRGCAVITEGLLSYLDPDIRSQLWMRLGQFMKPFPFGSYISDLHLRNETLTPPMSRMIQKGIEAASRGRLYVHFQNDLAAERDLGQAGFKQIKWSSAGTAANNQLRIFHAQLS